MASTTPDMTLFARGTIALINLWPALKLAVSEQWGGPESAEKRVWMISEVVDYFESCLPDTKNASTTTPEELAGIVDQDDLADLLENMIKDEFDVDFDDGSLDHVAGDIVKLWKKIVSGDKAMVDELEELVRTTGGKRVQAQGSGDDEVELDEDGNPLEDDESSEDEDVEMSGSSAQAQPKEKQEPVVDDDGFTLVQKKGKR